LEAGANDLQSVMEACTRYLAASPGEVVLVNLEDLWLETAPQNTPGTTNERVNWRRKSRLSLEEMQAEASLCDLLSRLSEIRPRPPEATP
jgi:4-alpha-glucanotransferase